MKYFKKFVSLTLNMGLRRSVRICYEWLLFQKKILFSKSDSLSVFGVEIRKIFLSNQIQQSLSGTVSYGPFKGLKFSNESSWIPGNRGNMLLGLYEREVAELIEIESKKFRYLIDVGAADGYFGLGALQSNLFEYAYCFESSEKGRLILTEVAQLNGIQDRVSIFGIADDKFLEEIPSAQIAESLVLLDIEGGEFSILTEHNLRKLSNNVLIVEMHHEFLANGEEVLDTFRRRAEIWFDVQVLETRSRDLSHIPEIRSWSDNDRWLVCSEGRPSLPTWWVLRPKQKNQIL